MHHDTVVAFRCTDFVSLSWQASQATSRQLPKLKRYQEIGGTSKEVEEVFSSREATILHDELATKEKVKTNKSQRIPGCTSPAMAFNPSTNLTKSLRTRRWILADDIIQVATVTQTARIRIPFCMPYSYGNRTTERRVLASCCWIPICRLWWNRRNDVVGA